MRSYLLVRAYLKAILLLLLLGKPVPEGPEAVFEERP